ncbi:hypothetical protein NGRA_2808 [Nosema granulosis]|uniref:Uncharacterized protein n=1 Tax=Nosema granulosis TaxID=83296 RepID=A0A9P6GVY4_9MICR|nr:hypothetical protein NGRA_2808 [Nosema granulosis]
MEFSNQPRNDADSILLDIDVSIKYIRHKGLIKEEITCTDEQCAGKMKIFMNKKYLNNHGYRCESCAKERSLFKGLPIDVPDMEISKHFRAIYKFLENLTEKNAIRNCGISKCSYQKLRGTYMVPLNALTVKFH